MHPDRKKYPYSPDKKYPQRHPARYPEETTPRMYPGWNYPDRNYPNPDDRNVDDRLPGGGGDDDKGKEDGPPDTCNTSYDAISVIRREVFIFKGKVSVSR